MWKTFAIGDLHGRADLLELALEQIEKHSPEGGTVVFLGDYIDRGFQSRQVIERLMAGPSGNWMWYALRGNHEEMMLYAGVTGNDVGGWMDNGGNMTLISYGQKIGDKPDPKGVIPQEHLHWISSLPYYFEDKYRIFVHAGIDDKIPMEDQNPHIMTWRRYDERDEGDPARGKHVVHGHESYKDGPRLWQYRTDLDTAAYYTGRLVVGVFDDDVPGGPVDFIEIQGQTHKDIWTASKLAMQGE